MKIDMEIVWGIVGIIGAPLSIWLVIRAALAVASIEFEYKNDKEDESTT